mgnify:CR=1 FL=1
MRLGKDLIGKQIITISDGRHVGKVKDIYLDRNLYWMTGIHLGREGFIRRKDNLIPRDSVVVFGIDAILIKDAAAVTDSNETDISDWIRLNEVDGREVDTPGGTKLANVGDVILDTEGKIIGFSLAKVTVDGPIAENRSIGRDVVIDNGNEDGVMTIDLVKAEQQSGQEEKPAADEEKPAAE